MSSYVSPSYIVPSMIFPVCAPIAALIAWSRRDLHAGLSAIAAGAVGWMIWIIIVVAVGAQSI